MQLTQMRVKGFLETIEDHWCTAYQEEGRTPKGDPSTDDAPRPVRTTHPLVTKPPLRRKD